VVTATEARHNHVDATRTRPQDGRAVDAKALASRRSEPSSSDGDGGLSDSGSESSSDGDGCLSEAEPGHEQAQPMVRSGRAALTGIQERGQVLGMDLWQVPRQDSTRNTYALEHGLAQRRLDFLQQVDRQQLKLCVPTCPLASVGTNV
jgi:hypothetical protein